MEILLLSICLVVGGYIIARLLGIDVLAVVEEWKEVLAVLIVVIPILGLAVALSTDTISPEELNHRTAALIQSGTVLIADHLTNVAIGAVVTPIAVFLITRVVRPIMDAFDL